MAFAAETFEHKKAHLLINKLKPTQEVKLPIYSVLIRQLKSTQVAGIWKFQTLEVYSLKALFNLLYVLLRFIGHNYNHTLKDRLAGRDAFKRLTQFDYFHMLIDDFRTLDRRYGSRDFFFFFLGISGRFLCLGLTHCCQL